MARTVKKLTKPQSVVIPALTKQLNRRVAAYARVSTDSEQQQSSIEAQQDYYIKLIDSRLDWTFAGLYVDNGISGTRTEHRKGFKQMMQDALDGKIDLIVTKSISRFARNTVDSLSAIRQLKEHGVEIFFEKEYIETALYLISTPNTGLFFAYCSIYCGFVGLLELAHYGLSLVCRLNIL